MAGTEERVGVKGEVTYVSKWLAHAPPKTEIYWVEVTTDLNKRLVFMRHAVNAPPENLWEGEEVEVIYRKHKEDDLVLPFIVTKGRSQS